MALQLAVAAASLLALPFIPCNQRYNSTSRCVLTPATSAVVQALVNPALRVLSNLMHCSPDWSDHITELFYYIMPLSGRYFLS